VPVSRYEAMTMALIEPRGQTAGAVLDSARYTWAQFLEHCIDDTKNVLSLVRRCLRGGALRLDWDPDSPAFSRQASEATDWPELDFEPLLSSPTG